MRSFFSHDIIFRKIDDIWYPNPNFFEVLIRNFIFQVLFRSVPKFQGPVSLLFRQVP